MDEEEFIDIVSREAQLESTDTAWDVTTATLQTLGERITDGATSDIAQHLPENVAETLIDAPGEAEPFSLDEFITRVSDRVGIDESDIVLYSRAVATALSVAAPTELETTREQLPPEFDVIFEPSGSITMDGFLETVQERASINARDAAQDATNTTLRALGERFSKGEATDLALYLPDDFKETLVGAGEERPTDDSFDEFVQRVARREGVEEEDAKTHAQAVCSTLAETASERELEAAKKQLPDPFGVIFEPPDTKNKDI